MHNYLKRLILALTACGLLFAMVTYATGQSALTNQRTLLVVDDHDILYRSGTRRLLQPMQRHSTKPVLGETKPWEVAIAWCSIYRNPESGKYQLWYQAYAGGFAKKRTHNCVVCYAESDDGIHFVKPNLGIHSINGIKETNIVLIGAGGRSTRYCNAVVVDPRDKDPNRRYKMAYFDFGMDEGKEYPGLHVAFSPDGIHWTKHTKTPILRCSYGSSGDPVPFQDDENSAWSVPISMSDAMDVFYDPRRDRLAAYGKMWIDGPDGGMYFKHAMGRIESEDFIHWSKPQLVLAPDDQDASSVEFHTSPVFFYNDVYFCLNQILDRATGGGVIDIELALSRDGLDWQRPFRDDYFLARGKDNAFDSGSIFTNATPVILEDEIRFYYGAYSMGATGADDTYQNSGIGLATLPRDRFAGLTPIPKSDQPTLREPLENIGQVTFKPIDLTSYDQITLNADATAGSIRVELLDLSARRIRGFDKANANPIQGDALEHQVTWNTKTLRQLPPGPHILRVHLNNATLHAVSLKQQAQSEPQTDR
ncbi:MAG: hypothetical protein ACR2NU_15180 [Aeoliella sp.]